MDKYYLLFVVFGAVSFLGLQIKKKIYPEFWLFTFYALAIAIFRERSNDYHSYTELFKCSTTNYCIADWELLYDFISKQVFSSGGSVKDFFAIIATFSILSKIYALRMLTPNWRIASSIYLLLYALPVEMGAIRQGLAISGLLLTVGFWNQEKYIAAVISGFFCTLAHRSGLQALILLVIPYSISKTRLSISMSAFITSSLAVLAAIGIEPLVKLVCENPFLNSELTMTLKSKLAAYLTMTHRLAPGFWLSVTKNFALNFIFVTLCLLFSSYRRISRTTALISMIGFSLMTGLATTPELATRLAAYFVVFEVILLASTCKIREVSSQVRMIAAAFVITFTIIRFVKFYNDWEPFYAPFRSH